MSPWPAFTEPVTTGKAEELDTQSLQHSVTLAVTAQGLAPSGYDKDNTGCLAE